MGDYKNVVPGVAGKLRFNPRYFSITRVTFISPYWPIQVQKTRAHVRLLGPCFKTGRVETDLLAQDARQGKGCSQKSIVNDKNICRNKVTPTTG